MNGLNLRVFNRLKYWVQLTLPLVYDDSLSYMELLAKIVDVVNGLGENYNELLLIVEQYGIDINQMKEDINKLINGDYIENYITALERWINNNLEKILANAVKFVFFGLTDDGYFVAYIPSSWNDITFKTTGLDIEYDYDYGHLVLIY